LLLHVCNYKDGDYSMSHSLLDSVSN